MSEHKVVSRDEWLASRVALLEKEKELTRLNAAIVKQRQELPWVKVEKPYQFDSAEGKVTLSDLFAGRSQLIVQHFMFHPDWKEGCVGCSFQADHVDSARQHLEHHDVTNVAVSRAPIDKIVAYKNRMGWKFNWVSAYMSDFNYDFGASFKKNETIDGQIFYNYELKEFDGEDGSGTSVFYKNDQGEIFHTYSCFGRGDEHLIGAYHLLELTPKGRNENGPGFDLTDWVKRHDAY
jgi:predicted dithiol-disulfide oxidoreductase (DUF899 family)